MVNHQSAVIIGTGSFLPEKILTNHDFEKFLDTSDEWITTRTGIKERHIVSDGQSTASMAHAAAQRAIEDARIEPDQIDLIIVATFTPELPLPATACLVQHSLGITDCGTFDLAAACSGFVYALSIAAQYIKGGVCRTVLVIGAETLSRFTDYQDRSSCILFGDGAGAVILAGSDDPDRGVRYSKLAADGSGTELLYVPAGGARRPPSPETIRNREHYIKLKGREIYKFAVQKMQLLIEDAMDKCGLAPEDISLIVPHQVNRRIIDSACQHVGFPVERVYVNIDHTGNTSSASVPLAFDEARRKGVIGPGDTVLMVAFGAGLTWASAVVTM